MPKIKPLPPTRLALLISAAGTAGAVLISIFVYGFSSEWSRLFSAEHLSLIGSGVIVSTIAVLFGYPFLWLDYKRHLGKQDPPSETKPRSPGRVTLFAFATGVVVVVMVFMVYSLFSGADGLSSADYFYLMRRLVIMLAVMAVLVLYPMLKVGYWLRARKQSPSAEK